MPERHLLLRPEANDSSGSPLLLCNLRGLSHSTFHPPPFLWRVLCRSLLHYLIIDNSQITDPSPELF